MSRATAFTPHDHRACMASALARVEADCARTGQRLTPVRRRVLEILLESHQALGAYDLLARLAEEGLGHQPPVVYRALSFLADLGVVHRIHRLNAYIACASDHATAPAFLICRSCRRVEERAAPEVSEALGRTASATGFAVERVAVEALGLCPACR